MNKKRYKAYLILFLIIFTSITQNLWSQPAERPDRTIQWQNFDLKTDTFASFFPESYKPDYQLVGFQGYDNPYTIGLPTGKVTETPVDLTRGRRALYATEAYDFPFFRISLEEMTGSSYVKNEKIYSEHLSYLKGISGLNEKLKTYKGYRYHLVSRKDLSFVGLRGHSTAAIGNIYVPEQKVIISTFFFNTKYHSDEPPLVDAEDIIKQLIDYYILYPRTK